MEGTQANLTLGKVIKACPDARTAQDPGFYSAELLARAMYLEAGVFPFLLVLKNGRGRYAAAGYNAGGIRMLVTQ
jgi:hypothetical protein